jgi:hypothetical protein
MIIQHLLVVVVVVGVVMRVVVEVGEGLEYLVEEMGEVVIISNIIPKRKHPLSLESLKWYPLILPEHLPFDLILIHHQGTLNQRHCHQQCNSNHHHIVVAWLVAPPPPRHNISTPPDVGPVKARDEENYYPMARCDFLEQQLQEEVEDSVIHNNSSIIIIMIIIVKEIYHIAMTKAPLRCTHKGRHRRVLLVRRDNDNNNNMVDDEHHPTSNNNNVMEEAIIVEDAAVIQQVEDETLMGVVTIITLVELVEVVVDEDKVGNEIVVMRKKQRGMLRMTMHEQLQARVSTGEKEVARDVVVVDNNNQDVEETEVNILRGDTLRLPQSLK